MEDIIRSQDLAVALAGAALDKKAQDAVILDMTGLVSYTDAFLLLTAGNRRHVQALADHLRKFAKDEHGIRCEGVEGMEAARWVLVDFGDVIVHIFDGPLRGFYDLDSLWADAPRVPAPEAPAVPAETRFQV